MSAGTAPQPPVSVSLECVDPRRDPLWQALLEARGGTLFHSPPWLEVLARTYEWEPRAYVTIGPDGIPHAGVVFCKLEDILGERVEVMPFSDYCDVLGNSGEDWNRMSGKLLETGCPLAVRCLNNLLPLQDPRFAPGKRAKWHGLDLRPSLDELWAGIKSAGQRAINKARLEGIEFVRNTDENAIRIFFDMHLGIRKYKYGYLAQPFRLFQNAWEQFIKPGNGFVLEARCGAQTIGGTVFLRWRDTLYYKWNASLRGELQWRPNDGIIWEAIRLAKAEGCRVLDFGLSDYDQEGLLRFKRKFGTVEKDIVTAVSRNAPPLDDSRADFRKVLREMTEIFVNPAIPDSLTERAGDLLYKYFA